MTAPPLVEREKEKEKEERNPHPGRSPMGIPCPAAYLQITRSMTSPTLVLSKKVRTASVYLLLDSNSLTVVLLGLALACVT